PSSETKKKMCRTIMSCDDTQLQPLVHELSPEVPAVAADWTHAAEARLAPPTSEQVRAADNVFAPRKEPETAAGLLGLWSSALILHDLAVETFNVPEEDDAQKMSPDEEE